MSGLLKQVKGFIDELFIQDDPEFMDDPIVNDETKEEDNTESISLRTDKRAVTPIRPLNNHGYEVVVIEPTSFNDSLEIAKNLSERKTVVLNLEMLENESSQRIVDFLAGATFALDGHQQKIGDGVFIFTPKNVNISSEQEKSQPITTEGFWNVPK